MGNSALELCFALPLLSQLIADSEVDSAKNKTLALVVVPTRELAQQIVDVVNSLELDYSPALLIGGLPVRRQQLDLKKDARLVIGTPGRLLDFLDQRILSLRDCSYFVLDEVDEMFSMGFIDDVKAILSKLPSERQGMFVSATINPRVSMFAERYLKQAEHVVVDKTAEDLPSIEHCYCEVSAGLMSKPDALCDLLEVNNPSSAIIFCNTRSDTDLLDALLRRRGFNARKLNSELTQNRRQEIMQQIRAGKLKYLVATDIAARGIDIEQIELVLNYAIGDEAEAYLHRTGRTGRAGRMGRAISIIAPQDRLSFRNVVNIVKAEFKKVALPTDEEVAKARLERVRSSLDSEDFDPDKRDILTAEYMISQSCNDTKEDRSEIASLVARFCSHLLKAEAAGEADELSREHKDVSDNNNPSRRKGRGRSVGRDSSRTRNKRSNSDRSRRGR